ncbi:HAMP domain-containing protein [bacterium]|nr:HAMP domain-containing protein [bacterium]
MIEFIKNLAIRWKMIGTLLGVVILLLIFNLFFLFSNISNIIQSGLEKKWESISMMLAYNASPGLVFDKKDAVLEAFQGVMNDPSLLYFTIYDINKSTFVSYNPGKMGVLTVADFVTQNKTKIYQGNALHLLTPIYDNQDQIGNLVLCISLSEIKEKISRNRVLVIIISLIIFILGAVLSIYLSGKISRPIVSLMNLTDEVSRGNLEVSFPIVSDDEIGRLANSFNRMVSNLHEVVRNAKAVAEGDLTGKLDMSGDLADAFNTMIDSLRMISDQAKKISKGDLSAGVNAGGDLAESFNYMLTGLRTITSSVKEAAQNIATSSSEISASTEELTSTASQQASAITQTTATVTELKQTAEQSAERANRVIELAKSAGAVSDSGLKAVEEVIRGIEIVQQGVETISEKISQLSTQTKKIGEIIASVNDIAEQSNLLALNASIEAARAGEHGKGFAVVADEVKNLAMQSKEATAEVRSILSNIKKATNVVVVSTAELSEKALDGVALAKEAGANIQEMAKAIKESSNSALQIAVTAREQTFGIDQIAIAMENINHSTRETLAGMNQTQKAVVDLSDLSQNMKAMVDQYTL